MSKPALSSRLLGLKFMQRAQEKDKKAEAHDAAEERDAEAHWVVEGARTRCVVIAEGDPPPSEVGSGSGAGGRLSFQGFNSDTEQLVADAAGAQAAAAAEAEAPGGKVVSDEAMAAALQRQKKTGQRQQGDGQPAQGQQREQQGGQGQQQRQRHGKRDSGRQSSEGGGGKHRGKHGDEKHGGKKHGRDEEDGVWGSGKKQRARYF